MIFIRIIFTIGYLMWGGMFLYAFGELMLRNAWLDIFTIETVQPTSIKFMPQAKETTEITYTFNYQDSIYTGSRQVINKIVEERLPVNQSEIEVSYNTLFPQINYLDQLGLKKRTGNVGMFISGFFFLIFLLIDLFANKKKWLGIYGLNK